MRLERFSRLEWTSGEKERRDKIEGQIPITGKISDATYLKGVSLPSQ